MLVNSKTNWLATIVQNISTHFKNFLNEDQNYLKK